MAGRVEQIYIANDSREPVQRVERANLVQGKGIIGDRYYKKSEMLLAKDQQAPSNHLSLIAKEELDRFLSEHNLDMAYGDFRRNLVSSGIDLNSLVGKEFSVGKALCFGTELCEPCAFLASSVHPAVLPNLVHRAGLRAVVLVGGEIEEGSEITV